MKKNIVVTLNCAPSWPGVLVIYRAQVHRWTQKGLVLLYIEMLIIELVIKISAISDSLEGKYTDSPKHSLHAIKKIF